MGAPLGERIRSHRQRKSWTLKDLASATGLSVPYLSDLERRSGVNPTLDTLTAVAMALDCTVADLVGDDQSHRDRVSLPSALARFVRSVEFEREVRLNADATKRPYDQVRAELVELLAAAPRRSSGEPSHTDWRRLMDAYRVIAADQ